MFGLNRLLNFYKRQKYIIQWFWKDAVLPYRWSIIWINILELLATASEVAAYGIIILFVDILEKKETIQLWKWEIEVSLTTNELIWYATIGATICFISNAFFKYLSKRAALHMSRRYDKYSTLRLVKVLNKALAGSQKSFPYPVKKAIIKDSRVSGTMLKAVATFSIPILKIVGSILFMFYINTVITLLILSLLPFAAFFMQRLGKKVVQLTQQKERLLPVFIRNIVKSIYDADALQQSTYTRMRTHFVDEDVENFYYAHYQAGVFAHQNLLIIKLCIALMTFLILGLVSQFILATQTTWDVLIGFVIAMQFFFRSLQGVARISQGVSQKIDYVMHYYTIYHAALEGTAQGNIEFLEDALQLDEVDDIDDFDDL